MILKVRNPNWRNRWEYFEGIEELSVAKEDYEFDEAGGVVLAGCYNPDEPDVVYAQVFVHRNFVTEAQNLDPEHRRKAILCFCQRNGQVFNIAFDGIADVYLLNDDGKTIERL